jgi:hypothetical protein
VPESAHHDPEEVLVDAMRMTWLPVPVILLVFSSAFPQTTFRADSESAIVWSGPQCKQSDTTVGGHEPLCDGLQGAHPEATAIVQDPLTGNSLRKISYQGVDIISGLRSYDVGCGWSECYTAYAATLTIVNNTDNPLKVDGNAFRSTMRRPTDKEIKKWWGKRVNVADFTPSSAMIQPGQSARINAYMVMEGRDSNITRWLNHTPFRVVPMRYSFRVIGKDFVFPWLAPLNTNFDAVPQWDY